MGAVWVAEDVTLKSQVAIKLLHHAVQDSEDGLKRFLREAQAAARLRSPHVVQILEHGVHQGVPFIAMELLEGESLAARLARLGSLSLGQTARIVSHVARAIGKAHDAGIVHRDLKPDNIFIVHNDDDEIVKVLDFGIAKMEQHLNEPMAKISTQEGALLGTPLYMSPEQVRGHGVDWRSDLWSLAIIAFECVCGRLPFDGRTVGDVLVLICSEPLPTPSTFRPLPPAFDAWFKRAAERDVAKRFQSAKEMAESLRAMVGEEMRTPMPSLSDSGPDVGRRISVDAPTVDQSDSIRDMERARTVSASGTMSGASSAVTTGARRSPTRIAAVSIAAAGLVIVAWLGLSRSPKVKPAPSPIASVVASTQPALAASIVPTPAATSAAVSVAAAPSAAPSASASHVHSAPSAKSTAAGATQLTKSGELAF